MLPGFADLFKGPYGPENMQRWKEKGNPEGASRTAGAGDAPHHLGHSRHIWVHSPPLAGPDRNGGQVAGIERREALGGREEAARLLVVISRMMQEVAVEDAGSGLLTDEVDRVPLPARNVDRMLGERGTSGHREAIAGHDREGEAVQGMPVLLL